MAYYRDLIQALRQAADQVAEILNGANPAELPFRQPTSFKLSINTKAARDIGVVVPPTLLATADEVIERMDGLPVMTQLGHCERDGHAPVVALDLVQLVCWIG